MKKVQRTYTAELKRDAFMRRQQQEYPVKTLCRVLGVSESGSSAWCQRLPSRSLAEHEQLVEPMRVAYEQGRHVYGSPRIHANLRAQGIACGKQVSMPSRNDVACTRRRASTAIRWLPICCSAIVPLLLPIAHGSGISLRCGQLRGGDTWWWPWMSLHGSSWAGPWLGIERRAWWNRLCGWHWADATLQRTCCTIPIGAKSHTSFASQTVLAQFQIQVSMSGTGNCYDHAMMESFTRIAENCMRASTGLSQLFGGETLDF